MGFVQIEVGVESRLSMKRTIVLSRAFYARPTLQTARELLGKVLVHSTVAGTAAGMIVEVEAYIGEDDPACHAASGLTCRNSPLYGPPGRAYVYLNYGLHCLVNAVTESIGYPAAVLIRALEPREGIELMRTRRWHGSSRFSDSMTDDALCRGPGNVTAALGITLEQNRTELSGDHLFIEDRGDRVFSPVWSQRIGIRDGLGRHWRGFVRDSRNVSGSRQTMESLR